MSFQTPIVLLLYNRPKKTEQLFDVIRQLKPKTLFVVADGPKNESDRELCDKTRKIVESIDWPLELKTNFSEQNQGNANRTISGLNWVFECTEKAIILEDDCIPDLSFFEFCSTLLDYYESDEKVMHISGCNLIEQFSHTASSYFFSKYVLPPWGWATWRRAWQKFNPKMDSWQKHKTNIHPNISQQNFKLWTDTFEYLRVNKVTWDIPWNVDIWANAGLGIIPRVNMITNIGFDNEATFTKKESEYSALKKSKMKMPLIHPLDKKLMFENEIEAACVRLLKGISE